MLIIILYRKTRGRLVLLIGILISEQVVEEVQVHPLTASLIEDASFGSQNIGYLEVKALVQRRCDKRCIIVNS